MPQIGGHLIIAERVKQQLGNPNYLNQNQEAYNLGAVGPDLHLFLFDRGGQLAIINTVLDVYQVLKDIEESISAVKEAILGPAEDLANWFTGGLYNSVTGLVGGAYDAFKALAILTIVPQAGNIEITNPFVAADAVIPGLPTEQTIKLEASDLSILFNEFGHPYSSNPGIGDYSQWWWVDILHYRRTGSFAHYLLSNSNQDNTIKAYSTGYWTHIGADVCGHPFVNAVVGGPFRNHVIRHMVIESVIDTWLWDHYKKESITTSGLEQYINVGNDFEKIAKYLISSMKDIYTDPVNHVKTKIAPSYFPNSLPDLSDLERAYRLMLLFLELSTNLNIEAPIPPPAGPAEFFEEIGDEIVDSIKKIGEPFEDFKWWHIFLLIFLLFKSAVNALVAIIKIITIPVHIIMKLSTHALRYAIYLLQMELYEYAECARWALVLAGWGKANSKDLNRAEAQLFVRVPPHRGGGRPDAFRFPYNSVPRNIQGFWLMDPLYLGVGLESPLSMESCPYQKAATPDHFVTGAGYANNLDRVLKEFAAPANIPRRTWDLEHETINSPQFGNAVGFSEMLIKGSFPPASFDLDSDRGYGHLCWEGPLPNYKYDEDLL